MGRANLARLIFSHTEQSGVVETVSDPLGLNSLLVVFVLALSLGDDMGGTRFISDLASHAKHHELQHSERAFSGDEKG